MHRDSENEVGSGPGRLSCLLVSDLHIEFHRDQGQSLVESLGPADVCVCAGDLGDSRVLETGLRLLCEHYAHVVFVAGNHEFYHSSISTVRQLLRDLEAELSSLHYLECSECQIEGRRFVGATLWTSRTPGIESFEPLMNDFQLISDAAPGIYDENAAAIRYLARAVQRDCIVVTHHLPHPDSIHPHFAGSPLNRFFLCDQSRLLRERRPRYWFHGHTHASCDYRVGRTRVMCNPFGYALHEVNGDFREHLLIDL